MRVIYDKFEPKIYNNKIKLRGIFADDLSNLSSSLPVGFLRFGRQSFFNTPLVQLKNSSSLYDIVDPIRKKQEQSNKISLFSNLNSIYFNNNNNDQTCPNFIRPPQRSNTTPKSSCKYNRLKGKFIDEEDEPLAEIPNLSKSRTAEQPESSKRSKSHIAEKAESSKRSKVEPAPAHLFNIIISQIPDEIINTSSDQSQQLKNYIKYLYDKGLVDDINRLKSEWNKINNLYIKNKLGNTTYNEINNILDQNIDAK